MAFVATKHKIILASTSKVRRKILQETAIDFEVIAPDYDEEEAKKTLKTKSIKETCLALSCGKALSLSKKFPDALIIGSDQICEFEKKAVSKSKDFSEAVSQLKAMQGKFHIQNNGVAVALNGKIIFKNFTIVKMKMRKISDAEILAYVETDQPWGCAGSYKYEALGKHLFEKVNGDYYAVLGMAIQPLISFFYKKSFISIQV